MFKDDMFIEAIYTPTGEIAINPVLDDDPVFRQGQIHAVKGELRYRVLAKRYAGVPYYSRARLIELGGVMGLDRDMEIKIVPFNELPADLQEFLLS